MGGVAGGNDLIARVGEGGDAALEVVSVFGLHVLTHDGLPLLTQGRLQRP
jgi:hypothetical protein